MQRSQRHVGFQELSFGHTCYYNTVFYSNYLHTLHIEHFDARDYIFLSLSPHLQHFCYYRITVKKKYNLKNVFDIFISRSTACFLFWSVFQWWVYRIDSFWGPLAFQSDRQSLSYIKQISECLLCTSTCLKCICLKGLWMYNL